jgi:hypothetical protein
LANEQLWSGLERSDKNPEIEAGLRAEVEAIWRRLSRQPKS